MQSWSPTPPPSSRSHHSLNSNSSPSHYHSQNSSSSPLNIRQPSSKLSNGLKQLKDQQLEDKDSNLPNSATNPKNLSHVPCKFYRQGTCQAGNACPFSHTMDVINQTPCKYFQKGNCKFGVKCANAHILPDGRRANSRNHEASSNGNGVKSSNSYIDNNHHDAQYIKSHHHNHNHNHNSYSIKNQNHHNHYSQSHNSGGSTTTTNAGVMTPTMISSFTNPSTPDRGGDESKAVQSLYQSAYSDYRISRSMSSSAANLWKDRSGSSSFTRGSLLAASSSVSDHPNHGASGLHHNHQPSSMSSFLNGSAISDEDENGDDEDDFGEDYVPSSLNELLTPQERQRRGSRSMTSATINSASMNSSGGTGSAASPSTTALSHDIWGGGAATGHTGTGSPISRGIVASSLPQRIHQAKNRTSSASASGDPFLDPSLSSPSQQLPIGTPDKKRSSSNNYFMSDHNSYNGGHSTLLQRVHSPPASAHTQTHGQVSQRQKQQQSMHPGRLGIEDDTQFFMEQDEHDGQADVHESDMLDKMNNLMI